MKSLLELSALCRIKVQWKMCRAVLLAWPSINFLTRNVRMRIGLQCLSRWSKQWGSTLDYRSFGWWKVQKILARWKCLQSIFNASRKDENRLWMMKTSKNSRSDENSQKMCLSRGSQQWGVCFWLSALRWWMSKMKNSNNRRLLCCQWMSLDA